MLQKEPVDGSNGLLELERRAGLMKFRPGGLGGGAPQEAGGLGRASCALAVKASGASLGFISVEPHRPRGFF